MAKIFRGTVVASIIPLAALCGVAIVNVVLGGDKSLAPLVAGTFLILGNRALWSITHRYNHTRQFAMATLFMGLIPVIVLGARLLLRYKATHDAHHGGLCIDVIKPVAADPAGAPLIYGVSGIDGGN